MIELKELNSRNHETTPEIDKNLNILLVRINKIRSAWGKPMTVTSGLRSKEDQARINPGAPKSKHLMGQACDISDKNGELKKWIKANVSVLESAGLWCESFDATPSWVHFQVVPPKSGNRFFIP